MQPKKFGVIGHPIGHSLSAVMHTKVFEEMNLPHTYEAFDVAPEDLERFLKNGKGLSGINITIPHKVAVMQYVDNLGQSAKDVHAVNTVDFGGQKTGHNTDGIGFLKSLEEEGVSPENKNVLVIGAGGASRAILMALANSNANITLTNRTKEKAEALTGELNIKDKVKIIDYTPENLEKELEDTYLIVNTTSLGMSPNIENSSVPKEALRKDHIIFDVVYNPLKTKLIKDAEEIGCKTISGVNMLVHQGAQSLRIWLGIEPPITAMKDAVLKALRNQVLSPRGLPRPS